jgi:hypothetical protein
MKRTVLLAAILGTLPAVSVLGAGNGNDLDDLEGLRLQNVPNSTTVGSNLVQGDEWTFNGGSGQHVALTVDTRDDFGNGTSGLDPVLVLKDPSGNVVDFADDNVQCNVNAVPVCGFQCPQINVNLPTTGKYTIIVRDFDTATTTGKQCNGGSYLLKVDGPDGVERSLSKAPTVDNGIVADPPSNQDGMRSRKGSGT